MAESVAKTSAVKTFHLVIDIEHVPPPKSGLGITFVDGDVIVPDRLSGKVGGTFVGISGQHRPDRRRPTTYYLKVAVQRLAQDRRRHAAVVVLRPGAGPPGRDRRARRT